jgi:hypothetical protein
VDATIETIFLRELLKIRETLGFKTIQRLALGGDGVK